MNILYIVNDFSYFRAHREMLAKYMVAAGHQVTVATGELHDLNPENWNHEIDLVELSVDRHKLSPITDIKMLWSLTKLIQETNADVVHCFTIKPILIGGIAIMLARKHQANLVWTFAGLGKIFEEGNSIFHKLRQKIVVSVLRTMGRRKRLQASFENASDRETLIEHKIFSHENATVIMGTGIDLRQYSPSSAARKSSSDVLTFVMAARLIKSKGVDTFLAMARHFSEKNSPCRFVLAGIWDETNPDGIDKSEIDRAVSDGDLEFVGSVSQSEMPALLNGADVFCLPTRLSEGFPRSLLEAASCGLAMIATDQAPMRTLIKPSQTGWLVKDGARDGFIAAAENALENSKTTREFGQQARQLVEKLPVDTQSINREFEILYDR